MFIYSTLNAVATTCTVLVLYDIILYFLVNSGLMANVKKAFTGEVEISNIPVIYLLTLKPS